MRTGRHDWLAEGLVLLADEGAPAVTIDRLCERMRRSKGSFYHHFGSMPKFRTELLERFEAHGTTNIIDTVESLGDLPAAGKLDRLLTEALDETRPELEIAVRAWAQQDPQAAATQERVDATRIGYVRGLLEQAGDEHADDVATVLYLVLVGAEHVMPRLPNDRLRSVIEMIRPAASPDQQ